MVYIYNGIRLGNKTEIWPFVATWIELESVVLSEISHREKDTVCFHSYVDPEKLKRNPWGRGREKKKRLGWERAKA